MCYHSGYYFKASDSTLGAQVRSLRAVNGNPFKKFGGGKSKRKGKLCLKGISFEAADGGIVLKVIKVIVLGSMVASALLSLVGCGSNLAFLAERSRTEAQALQEDCHAAGLSSGYVLIADTLVQQANLHWKEGDPLPAQQKSERAAAYYRLAMTESEAIGAKASVDSLHVARLKEEERLNTYQEFLNEARALRKP
jgi:hypothetical protein